MVNSYTLLADLKAGRCSNTAEVRLLRFWEARNIIKHGELMSVDLLFIDENSTLMQGSIGAVRQLKFRERLNEGSVYTLSGFDVARSKPTFRLTDSAFSIRFNDATFLQKVTNTARIIPTEMFRFRTYDQLNGLANNGTQLPDVMGELTQIRSTITDRLPGAQRVMLTLRLDCDTNVCVSMFDALAPAFHAKLDAYGKEPTIVLITSINPKIVGGRLYLNGTSATHMYFDSETNAGRAELDKLKVNGADASGSSSKVVHAQKIEPLTILELNEYILTSDPQVIEFLCTAKVTEIQLDEGWSYIGCSDCSKKLIREETSFTCVRCNKTNALAELKYRVILSVSDSTGTASFLAFDMEAAKLTHEPASETAKIVGMGVNAHVDTELPRSLAEIVGKTYTFQLKLTTFNFTVNHQTFTISRIFETGELLPMPAFVNQEGLPNIEAGPPAAPLPEGFESGSHAKIVHQGKDEVEASTSHGLLEGQAAPVQEPHDLDDKAPKKARVE